jgi:serine/threonine-protein kinase
MAEVFLARALAGPWTGCRVVVKRVHEWLADSDELREMFVREGALAMQLDHPNIVRVIDVGEEDGVPYLAMEWLDGVDLRQALSVVMQQGTRFRPSDACVIAAGVAAGLYYAHTLCDAAGQPLGIVHRDVSPHNVFLTSGGDVKLLDFGIAKTNRAATTRTGIVRGKAAYMSPEQLAGLEVDARSDLFALGVVLWEMLTGGRLWNVDTETGIARVVREESAPPPSVYVPELAGELDAYVLRLLGKFPSARPSSAASVRATLERLAVHYGARSPAHEIAQLVAYVRASLSR